MVTPEILKIPFNSIYFSSTFWTYIKKKVFELLDYGGRVDYEKGPFLVRNLELRRRFFRILKRY